MSKHRKPKKVTIEVCQRLMDWHNVPQFKNGQFVGMREAPKFHACIPDGEPRGSGAWGAGTTPYEAIGDLVASHPELFRVKVIELKGKQPR